MADNIDNFNTIVGLVFSQLYASFPTPVDIDEASIARAMNVEVTEREADWPMPLFDIGALPGGMPFRQALWPALKWLREEGFIRSIGDSGMIGAVLTSKALVALNASPSALETSLGSKLKSAAGGAGTEAGRAVIGEVVGQVIGAVFKSML